MVTTNRLHTKITMWMWTPRRPLKQPDQYWSSEIRASVPTLEFFHVCVYRCIVLPVFNNLHGWVV